MLHTRSWTKRPREALLQLDIELGLYLFSIGGSLDASRDNSEIPPLYYFSSNYRFAPKDSVWWVVYLGRMPPKK
jgi:hypothetical protein